MTDALLTLPDVAELLAVSERTVWRLRAAGALPVVRIGHQVRFRAADVSAYIERQTEPGAAA
jgi:excisionase family DNA binding protein